MTMSAAKPGRSSDAIELLTGQHREVEAAWSQLQAAHSSASEVQQGLAARIIAMLSKHDAIETQLLYPELRKVGNAQGEKLSDHSLDDHQRVRELLDEVDGKDVGDESVYERLARCLSDVMDHVAEEEQQVFPLLRQCVSQERLAELGRQMASAMELAPTHPHPNTPDSKVGATVVGAVSGLVDKARDAIREARKG